MIHFFGGTMKNQRGRNILRMLLPLVLVWLGIFAFAGSAQDQPSLIEQGRKLFTPTCSNAYCHGANGENGSAPTLRGRNFTAEHLARVISEGVPGTPMPG